MYWQDLCEHPSLKNLPFKIELNKMGNIIMSPTKVYHSFYQAKLSGLLYKHLTKGEALVECAIHTQQGTKVADTAWAFEKRFNQIRDEIQCSVAPEICIEVLSDSNTQQEMYIKKQLYFDNGAVEVWLCNSQGKLRFFTMKEELNRSCIAPHFPGSI